MGKATYNRQPADNCEQGCASKTQRDANNEPKEEVPATISFRIAVFYDGTGNNKLNTFAAAVVRDQEKESPEKIENNAEELKGISEAYDYLGEEELKKRIESGKKNFKEKRIKYRDEVTAISYLGAETNVYKIFRDLETCKNPQPVEGADKTNWVVFKKLYIEGIGTFSGEDDTSWGGGLAKGNSGITMRVKEARDRVCDFVIDKVAQLEQCLKEKKISEIKIENIFLDFFGFSRGAACARYSCKFFLHGDAIAKRPNFTSGLLPTAPDLEIFLPLKRAIQIRLSYKWKIKFSGDIIVKDIGLFDTVSSHGLAGTLFEVSPDSLFKPLSDVMWLSLDSITEATGKVYHITAKDEFRKNFALTNNKSKGDRVPLRGAHSDIGGGYYKIEHEYKPVAVLDSIRHAMSMAFWFKKEGWVKNIIRKETLNPFSSSKEYKYEEWDFFPNGHLMVKPCDVSFKKVIEAAEKKEDNEILKDKKILIISDHYDKHVLTLLRRDIPNTYANKALKLMIDQFTDSFKFKKDSNREFVLPGDKNEHDFFHFSGDINKTLTIIEAYGLKGQDVGKSKDMFEHHHKIEEIFKREPFKRVEHNG
jgi:hypothetical protein